jgi:hypothetical protein
LQKCTSDEVLRAVYDPFALPYNPNQLKIFFRGDVWCPQQSGGDSAGTFPRRGVLFSLGELDILIDCSGAIVVNGGVLGQVAYPVQLNSGKNTLQFIFSLDKFNYEQPVGLCFDSGQQAAPAAVVQPPDLVQNLTMRDASLLFNGISIGPRSTNVPAVRASITQFILQAGDIADSSNGSNEAGVPLLTGFFTTPLRSLCSLEENLNIIGINLDTSTAENTLPEVTALQIKSAVVWGRGESSVVEVEEEVELVAAAQDLDGDELQLEVTVYGVPPEDCSKTTCGDATFSTVGGSSGKAQLTAKVSFPLPGRYIVRARVSDGSGRVAWKDLVVTVYKKGDTAVRAAPCCRHTSYITAHNLGRPVDKTYFRAKGSEMTALGVDFGWSSEYWSGADVEAERLFDYSILAPAMQGFPVETLTCADVRIGGAGGPEVYGLLWAEEDTSGHGKSLTIVPESFESWATGALDAECAKHWSYNARNNTSTSCIVGCTSEMIENHIQTTGMVDQYSQALIQLSYGALHVSPRVRVLPEVQVAKEPIVPGDTTFGYYDTPSQFAVESAGLARPWMVLTLAPMAQHKVPKHRAWSAGISSGRATITKCFASMYYSVHETGHRLGFKHGQLLILPAGHAVPADPLGASDSATIQIVPDERYSQRLDIMSCCKSDFGLFHRTVTGWLKNSKRTVISREELAQPSKQKLILWPFDRSESRGKHVSLAIRRSDDEILLVGFRSLSHWQEQDSNNGNNTSSNGPEDHRLNVRGLQVEYLIRNPNKGNLAWSARAILDFNVMHGDYPHALPLGPGEVSQQTQFSLLKEGRSWYDSTSRLLLSFERIAECDSTPEVNVYNYKVDKFYGFNGEWPGKEAFIEHDYAGYAELPCAHLSITTAAEPPKGKLDVNVELQQDLDREVGSYSSQNTACVNTSNNNNSSNQGLPDPLSREQPLMGRTPSTSPATTLVNFKLIWNDELDNMASIVWKDRWNRTLQARYSKRFTINTNTNTIGENSISVLPASLPITAHILGSDGRHTRIEISTEKLSTKKNYLLIAKKRYYQLPEKIITDSPALILGSLSACQDQMDLISKRKQDKAMILWMIIIGSLLAALLLGGAITWLVCKLRQWRLRKSFEEELGKEERRRTTTPAALAEAAAQCSSSTASSFTIEK